MRSETAETTVAAMVTCVSQMLPTKSYPHGLLAAVGSQKEAPPLRDQCKNTYSENFQDGCHGDHKIYIPEDAPKWSQEDHFPGGTGLITARNKFQRSSKCQKPWGTATPPQKGEMVMLQKTALLGDGSSHSQKEDPQCSTGMTSLGHSSSHTKEEASERFRRQTPWMTRAATARRQNW